MQVQPMLSIEYGMLMSESTIPSNVIPPSSNGVDVYITSPWNHMVEARNTDSDSFMVMWAIFFSLDFPSYGYRELF